jgi:chemotaxis protein methyltransferase CheR
MTARLPLAPDTAAASSPGLIPGVSPDLYREQDFVAISRILQTDAGIVLPRAKAMLVYSRIAPLVRESGAMTFSAYIDLIRKDPVARNRTICALTTNHTFFYREAHHFEHFAREVRPGLIRNLEAGGRARLWSAGCSSGEETWSLVMTLLGEDRAAGTRLAGMDVRVLASDLADHALERAEAAIYPVTDLKAVPRELVAPWVREEAETGILGPEARRLVSFRKLNLQGEWPMRGRFDVIFCRNVMIYFDGPTKERLVARLTEQLLPGGWLYIGHSERATGPAAAMLTQTGPTTYRKRMA